MATFIENMGLVRLLLDNPDPHQPQQNQLFELLYQQVQHHLNQLNNASTTWTVNYWTFGVNEGQEDYLVTAADFGKPFLVYTSDPSDTYHVRSEVPFALLQNQTDFYSGPQQAGGTGDNIHTAATIAFYRRYDGWYARVSPIPGGSSDYIVWYETGAYLNPSFGDSRGLSPFHHLIRVQTAVAALPYCQWGDVRFDSDKAAAWERKCAALGMALAKSEANFQREFDTYKATLMQAGVEARVGFGDDYLADDGIGGAGVMAPNQW